MKSTAEHRKSAGGKKIIGISQSYVRMVPVLGRSGGCLYQASEVAFSLTIQRTLLRPELLLFGGFGAHKSCMTVDTLHETKHVPTNSSKIRTQDVLKYAFIE